MPTDDFPPSAWLGYGLNMTQVTPIDINLVSGTSSLEIKDLL